MSTFQALVDSPLVHRLGWTLVHSLWQAAVVALLLALVLVLLKKHGPQARYLASCAALLAVAVLPVATFSLVQTADPKPVAPQRNSAHPAVDIGPVAAATVAPQPLPDRDPMPAPRPVEAPAEVRANEAPAPEPTNPAARRSGARQPPQAAAAAAPPKLWRRAADWFQSALPWGVLFWAAGVLLLSVYQLGG